MFVWRQFPLPWASELAGVPPSRNKPLDLSLSFKKKGFAISIQTFLSLIGLGALQRDLNKIISLLLSPQWSKQNPSEKRQTKQVRKCVGNEVRPLNEDPDQRGYYERTPEPSFIAADCLPFIF